MNLNESQLIGKQKILNFLKSSNKCFLLQGSAGTGKTTLIVDVLKELTTKKIIFSAPTNKAVSVLEIMCPLKGNNITYNTIQKLLNIKRYIDIEGEEKFIYMDSPYKTKINKCDILVIDECSMINRTLYEHIENSLRKYKFKIIFIGDINQLPPINETKSIVFSKNYESFKLTKIERFKNDIVKYSNSIIGGSRVKYRELGPEINFENNTNIWLKTYDIDKSVILAYTNKRTTFINTYIRTMLFSDTNNKLLMNEKIVFNNYYKSDDTAFYTSEMGIIKNISKSIYKFKELPLQDILNLKLDLKKNNSNSLIEKSNCNETCPICYEEDIDIMSQTKCGHLFCNMCIKLWLEKNKCCPMCRCSLIDKNTICIKDNSEISSIINELISYTNNLTIKINYLFIENDIKSGNITIIDPTCLEDYNKIYNIIQTKLKKFKNNISKKTNNFNNIILLRIWEFFYTNYIDIFAKIDYGYCITIHKSQGSTYENVFLDLKDIIEYNRNDAKQCVYTGITRAAKNLKILK